MDRIGVIGTGLMGGAVAARLVDRGYVVFTRDIRPVADAAARASGATICATPAEVARAAPLVIILVIDGAQVEAVLFGPDGVVGAMAAGGIVVLSSTLAPDFVARMARGMEAAGLQLIDAPVSGGPVRARDGSMTVMVGAPPALMDQLRPLFADIAGPLFHVGPAAGDGSKAKIVNNMIGGTVLVASCEGMALGMKLGLDPAMLFDVVMASAGGSFMFGSRMPRVLADDFTPHAAMRILNKDLGLALAAAGAAGSRVPLATLASDVFQTTIAAGHGDKDDAAVINYYRDV